MDQEISLDELSVAELFGKLAERLVLLANRIHHIFDQDPRGILVLSKQIKRQVTATCSPGGPNQSLTLVQLPFSAVDSIWLQRQMCLLGSSFFQALLILKD